MYIHFVNKNFAELDKGVKTEKQWTSLKNGGILMSEETKNEVTELQESNQEQASSEEITAEDKKSFTKYRVERAEKNKEKEILSVLGVSSVEEAKNKISSIPEYEKKIAEFQEKNEKAKHLEYKVEAMKSGFDDKFVDFIVHELKGKVSENETFPSLLEKFKSENPQYLKNQSSGIKISTAPNFENSFRGQNASEIINDLIRGGKNK